MPAPASKANEATFPLNVSIDILTSGNEATIFSIYGIVRFISSSILTSDPLGFDEKPPISIIEAPIFKSNSTFFKALSIELYFPPSKNESGVVFRILITIGRSKLMRFPLKFIE